MKKKNILLGVCILMFVFVGSVVSATIECCVWIKDGGNTSACGYQELTNSTFDAEGLCKGLAWFYSGSTSNGIFNNSVDTDCASYTASLTKCQGIPQQDINNIPEFGTIAATLALSGASMGYIFIRRKRK